jgi:hypothetical protein
MTELKYATNIVTEDFMPKVSPTPPEIITMLEEEEKAGNIIDRTMMFAIKDAIVKGSFFMGCEWVWGVQGEGVQTEIAHHHDCDEIIGFVGSKKENPRELNGEIELWIEDEKYLLTKSCLIFIPAGTKHCPLIFRRVDSPIFMFESANSGFYDKLK